MIVNINENDARFEAAVIHPNNITARNVNGWLSNGWTGEQLLEEYASQTSGTIERHMPTYWGWTIQKSPANFGFYIVGRSLGSGANTRNPYEPGLWFALSVILRNNSSPSVYIRHPMVLDHSVQGFANGDEVRQILARNFEYRVLLAEVPNANDTGREAAAANNLPDDFDMEFRVFI